MEHEPALQFTVRKAIPEDVVSARAMQAASWLATYPNEAAGVSMEWVKDRTDAWLEPDKLEQSKEFLERILNDPTQFYRLAEQNGEVVGFIHLMMKKDGVKHLEAIYTNPDTFGSGIGAGLIEAAEEWIEGSQVTLEVASYNERAQRFYEKYGFKKIEGSEHLYADTIPVVDMIREGDNS